MQRIDTAWWRPYDSTKMLLFVGNTAEAPNQVRIRVKSNTGAPLQDLQLTIAPNATIKLDIFSLLAASPNVGTVGTLSIGYSGPHHSIMAFGSLEDQTNGFCNSAFD